MEIYDLLRSRVVLIAGLLLLFLSTLGVHVDARPVAISSVRPFKLRLHVNRHERRLASQVEEPPLILTYHNGPILSRNCSSDIPVYIIWYGYFAKGQRHTILDFFHSFQSNYSTRKLHTRSSKQEQHACVKSWWNVTGGYMDMSGEPVAPFMHVAGERRDRDCSKGKILSNQDLETLVLDSLSTFLPTPCALYLVLTAQDVFVDDFCMNSCASHFSTDASAATKNEQLPFAWVGNSGLQCPGECAWPFANPEYGPNNPALKPPNADVGMDGMIINLGSMLAGSATNPFNSGFYQGDAAAPLEAATACTGMYGENAYPGYPGDLFLDPKSGASFNARGINHRKFLLPSLWDPFTLQCTAPTHHHNH